MKRTEAVEDLTNGLGVHGVSLPSAAKLGWRA
jgi:hypothetical protein